MGNYSDRLLMPQTRYRTAIDDLEDTSLGLYGGVGRLIENTPHVAIALRRSVAVVDSRALFVARACTNPRRQVLLGGKGRRRGAHFGNDLLRRIHAQTGHFCSRCTAS
jgi:hypothetical protein